MRTNLHLHHAETGRSPATELALERPIVIGGKAPAAIHGNARTNHAEQLHQGNVQQPGAKIPQSIVDRRDRHRSDPGLAKIANVAIKSLTNRAMLKRLAAMNDFFKQCLRQLSGRGIGVGVANAGCSSGLHTDQDHSGAVPGVCSVCLWRIRWHSKDFHLTL